MKKIVFLIMLSMLMLPACQKEQPKPDLVMPEGGPDLESMRPLTPPPAN